MAPKLLAKVVAKVVAANAVALDFITAAGSGIEDVMYRREFCGVALVELKEVKYAALKPGALDLHGFAAGEPGVDDTVSEWLGSLSLSELA
jgi:translation initiation factor 4G